jgi:hypothetical protein
VTVRDRVGVAFLALAACVGGGCVSLSGSFGTPIPEELLGRIVVGETTRDEILAWFGPPSAFYNPTFLDVILEQEQNADQFASLAEDVDLEPPAPVLNDVFTYRYIENDTRALFIPLVFGLLDAAATYETLTVFFDDDGRVEYHAFRRDEARAQ